ncbi:MAG: FkbM family methyltransferase [Bacteroidetes bacterium]|nr:FkbM family methyltransferase [Bacteroidota bacterium]
MNLSTRQKIRIANMLYRSLRFFGVRRHRSKVIDGITYELDLAEGIDLSLFLFGSFQKHVLPDVVPVDVPVTILDVGANAGVMSLQYARKFPLATIHAFEPSDYANERFDRNLHVNPGLASRIHRVKTFVSDTVDVSESYVSYSSWRIDSLRGERHPVHLGSSHATVDRYLTIDAYCETEGIDDVAFIKIDTDGYEYEVLRGAASTISIQRPAVVFELATYILEERGIAWPELIAPLTAHGYVFSDSRTGRRIDDRLLDVPVPRAGSIDVLALPPEASAGRRTG